VHERHLGVAVAKGAFRSEANASLDAEASVDGTLSGYFVGRTAAQDSPFAGVGTLSVLSHDFESRPLSQRSGYSRKGRKLM
jgi:hypothetical protein